MTDSPRSRFRLPHWGWFLLATVALVVGFIGLSVWLPYHREQQVIQKIEGWGGTVGTQIVGPEWLRRLVGEDRMRECKLFERVISVESYAATITDAEADQLSSLTNLEVIWLHGTAVTDNGIEELQKALPDCAIGG